jgi:16S rRNA (cytosine967-C5)-methyltransferase
MTAREISAKVLSEVFRHRNHLDIVLGKSLNLYSDKREQRLSQEICYGVMRWYNQLFFINNQLINKNIKEKDADILALILSGIYQIKFMRIPDHAAISATVETAQLLNKGWAKDLINAVLRRYQREKNEIEQKIIDNPVAYFSHPDWIIKKLQTQWPEYWRTILTANNNYPPLHVRLNLEKLSRKNYLEILQENAIECSISKLVKTGIVIKDPMVVENIPGFLEGHNSIQDFGAQLAGTLLDCQKGHRVLDVCAAPGGKSTHILELYPDIQELVSVDISTERSLKIKESLKRLDLNAVIIVADASKTTQWWDGNPFDRILLDPPCTASGVIRRHPDIKFSREPEQLAALVNLQQAILINIWPLLKPAGILLYCTCSLFKEESDEQIANFLRKNNNAMSLPIDADWGVLSQFGRHTIPGHDESDGFYYSLIVKKP